MLCRLAAILLASSTTALFAGGLAAAGQKDEEPAAKILAPKDGAEVGRVEELKGRLTGRKGGWPVILVRPLGGCGPFYREPTVRGGEGGAVRAGLYGGEGCPPSGNEFRIVVLVGKKREEAQKVKRGTTLRALAPDLPESEPITVVRK